MKITNLITDPENYLQIMKADYLKAYQIRLTFNDAIVVLVDFEDFLANSNHPDIRKYLDSNLFKQFSIINGNLNWFDYDLIFPIEDLYSGKLTARPNLLRTTAI